ncbi:MAG: aquaporin Z [Micrococcaceae bacterium]
MENASLSAKLAAEFFGTFVLVFGGCGAAIYTASFMDAEGAAYGIGILCVALAFGLCVLVSAYAVGHLSGGHFNPAVTLGAMLAGRLPGRLAVPYWLTQLIASVVAAAALYLIATGRPGFSLAVDGFAVNGYGELSPAGYSLTAVLATEFVVTMLFLFIILGATDRRAPAGFAPLAIGLALTMLILVSIPISNASLNPARSFGVVMFAGGEALGQLWVFFVAPLAGAAVAGWTYRFLFPNTSDRIQERTEPEASDTATEEETVAADQQ